MELPRFRAARYGPLRSDFTNTSFGLTGTRRAPPALVNPTRARSGRPAGAATQESRSGLTALQPRASGNRDKCGYAEHSMLRICGEPEVALAGSDVPLLSTHDRAPWGTVLACVRPIGGISDHSCRRSRSTMSEATERGGAALGLDAVEIRAADRAARIWQAGESCPIVFGSETHKR